MGKFDFPPADHKGRDTVATLVRDGRAGGEAQPGLAVALTDQVHGAETLCRVRETKGNASRDDLRPVERRKIECGDAHFAVALGIDDKDIRPPFGFDCLPWPGGS